MTLTPDELAAQFAKVTDAIWLASAMAAVLDRGSVGACPNTDPAAAVLAS